MNLNTINPAIGGVTSGSTITPERRRHPRFAFTAAALAFEPVSGTRIDARTADVSLNGCYVDTMVPFPAGSRVSLRLSSDGKSFECDARVVFSQAGMGMGLVFVRYRPEQFQVLQEWIAELSGETLSLHQLAQEPVNEARNRGAGEEQLYVLNELIVLLVQKGVLTEEEGQTLLHRLFRQDGML